MNLTISSNDGSERLHLARFTPSDGIAMDISFESFGGCVDGNEVLLGFHFQPWGRRGETTEEKLRRLLSETYVELRRTVVRKGLIEDIEAVLG